MAVKDLMKAQPVEADVTRAPLFSNPDYRKIAGMIGETAAIKLLGSVAKLSSRYAGGEISMADWNAGVMRLAADAVLPAGQSSEKLKKALESLPDSPSPALSSLKVAVASYPHTKVLQVFKIVDLLRPEVIAQKCGITREDAKDLMEMRLPAAGIVELVGKARLWNAQLEAGTITQNQWDERVGRAIFGLDPDYQPYDALLLREKLMKIEPAAPEAKAAVYKKIR